MEILFLKDGSTKKNRFKKPAHFFLFYPGLCFVSNAIQHYFNEGRFMEEFSYPVISSLYRNLYHVHS